MSSNAQSTPEKPEFLDALVQHVKDNIDVQWRFGIETDDLVAKFLDYYGKDKAIIVSIDKDYRQFECTIFNYRKREFITVNKDQALYNMYEQMVVGDRADNGIDCTGEGEKW